MSKAIEAPWLAQERGMTRLVFEDDFDLMGTIDNENTGKPGYKWYVSRAYKASVLEPVADYRVENSVLTLCNREPTYNYGLCSYNAREDHGFAFFKGVMEFRFRIPRPRANNAEAGETGVPAVWSFPPDKLTDETLDWVEPDWLEYWGDGYWTTTVHHQKRGVKCGPLVAWASNPNHRGPDGLNDGEWHSMTCLWDDGVLETHVDGNLAVRVTYAPQEISPNPSYHNCEAFDDLYQPLERNPQAIILGGSACNPLELDWIRVWQK